MGLRGLFQDFFRNLKIIFQCFSYRTRIRIFWLAILVFISGFLEMISIASVFPLIQIVLSEDPIQSTFGEYEFIFNSIFHFIDPVPFIVTCFILFTLFSGVIRVISQKKLIHFSFYSGGEVSKKLLEKTLYREFRDVLNSNSADTVTAIFAKSNEVTVQVLLPILNIINAIFSSIIILIMLTFVNYQVVVILIFIISILYLTFGLFVKRQIVSNGIIVNKYSNHIMRHLQESSAGIREIIFNNLYDENLRKFSNLDVKVREAKSKITIIGIVPKYIVETLFLILMALAVYSVYSDSLLFSSRESFIAIIGMFVLGAQKLLPLFQQIFNGLTQIRGSIPALEEVTSIIINNGSSNTHEDEIGMMDTFEISRGSFSYSQSKSLLKNINFSFKSGDVIGIVGKTGSGKSTILDIISGLLFLNKGDVMINEKSLTSKNVYSWRSQICYVPQDIFLFDDTVYNNLIYNGSKGFERLDYVRHVCDICCIDDDIMSFPNNYLTKVGERATRLSGGQIQRIGIARALLANKNVIILDEATSALNTEVEAEMLEKLFKHFKTKTFIIVTHRPEVLKYCNQILKVENNTVNS